MLYAMLCYHDEDVVGSWSKEQDEAVMAKLAGRAGEARQAGPARPGGAAAADHRATTLRKDDPPLVIDGPYAETKEQLLGFYIVDCANLDEALDVAARLGAANPGGAYEIRPVGMFAAAEAARDVTDIAWIDAALTSARPQAVGALLRYFRDLDTAEEAFQDACLRALKNWPQNGPPRDPAAWLIMVGRNAAIDEVRREPQAGPLPDEEAISDLDDAEERAGRAARRLALPRRHPAAAVHLLPSGSAGDAADRARPAHRLRPYGEADRARLSGQRGAMEQRITRAKARIAGAEVPFETPGAVERSERLAAVAAMIYLIFNEGYSASGDTATIRADLCAKRRSGWRGCCCGCSRASRRSWA